MAIYSPPASSNVLPSPYGVRHSLAAQNSQAPQTYYYYPQSNVGYTSDNYLRQNPNSVSKQTKTVGIIAGALVLAAVFIPLLTRQRRPLMTVALRESQGLPKLDIDISPRMRRYLERDFGSFLPRSGKKVEPLEPIDPTDHLSMYTEAAKYKALQKEQMLDGLRNFTKRFNRIDPDWRNQDYAKRAMAERAAFLQKILTREEMEKIIGFKLPDPLPTHYS